MIMAKAANTSNKQIETLADLTPDPRNARKHNPRNVGMLEKSLNEVGAARSIVIDENGVVLAGNATIEAAGRAGIERVQVVDADGETIVAVRRTGLTQTQKTRLALYDNRTAELADWDADVIADLMANERAMLDGLFENNELLELIENIDQTGSADAEPQIDRAAELNEKWQVKPQDLWRIGNHRLLCGDCTVREDVQRVMGGEKWELLFTSPPYGGGKNSGYKPNYNGERKQFYNHDRDDMTRDKWIKFCNLWLVEAAEVILNSQCPAIVNLMYTANNRDGYGVVMFAGSHPFKVRETICWDKAKGFPSASSGILSRNWELVFVISIAEKYRTTQGDNEVRFAKWKTDAHNQTDTLKATFPLELPAQAIKDFGGESVYEPFAGSGTTLVASENLQRKCFGIEISPNYCAVILERMQTAFPALVIERIT